jgi:hypothetical protein
MEELVSRLKQEVITAASNPGFLHKNWYVKYHLEIVERISLELCAIYEEADRNLVLTIVWLHDYGKILGSDDEMTATAGKPKLLELGFTEEFANRVIQHIRLIDEKLNIEEAPIEAKIVSSADGASHLVGPFPHFWWYEHNDKPIQELMKDNYEKVQRDWTKKIVLPEVRDSFLTRYRLRLEQSGILPKRFLQCAREEEIAQP